ncbi:MAG: methyltransferase domain-containing protein [Gammaproteobacteria bacterium]|nr:methyltransferase domain-containing protein [Gammaproteobacteria bacterium]
MSKTPNMLSAIEPWDLVAAGYAETTMQMFAPYVDEAIAASHLKPGAAILDIACGPGTLALKVAREASVVHGIDFSAAMLDIFKQHAGRAGHKNIVMRHGDAQALPYADEMFDAAFSIFGLMFFPDRRKGFAEIHRTLKAGGSLAVTSWAPVSQSPAMQIMFGAIRAIKPDLPEPQRVIDSLENPDTFKQEMQNAGFKKVTIQCVRKAAFPVTSVPAFWEGMVKGSAPIQMLKKNLGENLWREKEPLALNYLERNLPSLPTALSSDAWLGLGGK